MQLPLYILVDGKWIRGDESTGVEKLLPGWKMESIRLNDELHACLFTTPPQALKYVAMRRLPETRRAWPLELPHECIAVLEGIAAAGVANIVLDFADSFPAIYPVDYLLGQVRAASLKRSDGG